MKIPLIKLKAILRYFCTYTNPDLLGKTKLMKLFYFMDFGHVKKYGVPITFDRYVHLERGPIPSDILNLVNSVVDVPESAELADTVLIRHQSGEGLQQIVCKQPFSEDDKKYFTERELETLEQTCRTFDRVGTKEIVKISHDQSAWKNTNENAEIPYTLAALDDDSTVDEEEIRLLVSSV